MYTGWDI